MRLTFKEIQILCNWGDNILKIFLTDICDNDLTLLEHNICFLKDNHVPFVPSSKQELEALKTSKSLTQTSNWFSNKVNDFKNRNY